MKAVPGARRRPRAARWICGVVGLVAAVGLLTSCALLGVDQTVLAASPAATETARPPFDDVTGPTPSSSPARRLSAEQTRGLESTPWVPLATTGTRLTIKYVAGGGCSAFAGIRVRETSTAVEIWTAVRTDHAAQACAAYLGIGATELQLKAPLGGRALLHAPVSPEWKSYVGEF